MTFTGIPRKPLPCYPCPHGAPCCRNGTILTPAEAQEISAQFGADKVLRLGPDELRSRFKLDLDFEGNGITEQWVTAIKGNHCVFWDQGCKIYASSAYPRSCGLYPWQETDHSSHPPEDAYVCPELGILEPDFVIK